MRLSKSIDPRSTKNNVKLRIVWYSEREWLSGGRPHYKKPTSKDLALLIDKEEMQADERNA